MLRRIIYPENAHHHRHGQVVRATMLVVRFGCALVVAVLGLTSCARAPRHDEIVLPSTPVVSLRPDWAVATELYTRVLTEPSEDSAIAGHLRRGDVAEVVSVSKRVFAAREGSAWFELETDSLRGWVQAWTCDFYDSRLRARNAAAYLTGNTTTDAPPSSSVEGQ